MLQNAPMYSYIPAKAHLISTCAVLASVTEKYGRVSEQIIEQAKRLIVFPYRDVNFREPNFFERLLKVNKLEN
jgi:hypothetical protein